MILATVKGDIHDIGKNIVKVLLENYGFQVMDLGRDVPPEIIAAAAVEGHVPVVGLSALMTTTVPAMERTIRLFKGKRHPGLKSWWAARYSQRSMPIPSAPTRIAKDAMASVNFAVKYVKKNIKN